MSGSQMNNEPEHKSPRESGEDSEDESEILEESPCGRWLKRREEVSNSLFLLNFFKSHSSNLTTAYRQPFWPNYYHKSACSTDRTCGSILAPI